MNLNTTDTPLVERYLRAVSDAVGHAQREEVTAEVRSALADAVEAHVERGESLADAERAAVIELGDPGVLAAQYRGRPQHLIGPTHYPTYRMLLRLLVAIVVPIVGIVVLLAEALSGSGPLSVLGTALWASFQTGMQLAFWVTVVFAVLERTGASAGFGEWTPDQLPELPDRRIGLTETVFSITVIVLLIVGLILGRTNWLVTGASGTPVPVIDPQVWTFWMPVLIAILLATVVFEVVKYRIGHWTVALATVNTILSGAFAGVVVWLWTSDQLLNPEISMPEGVAIMIGLIPWLVVIISVAEIVQGWWAVRLNRRFREQ